MTKKPFVGQSAIANGLLDLVHINVCGPLSIPARGGFSYFITFIDDHSRYGYVCLMRYKSEAFGSEEPQHDRTTSFEPTVHTDGVLVSTRKSRVPERYGFVGLTSQLDNDPKTYGEAMSDIDSDKWLEAMKSEMNSMGSNQARLVAKGYTQQPGVDFEETYSPVAMAKSIRILLAIAAWYDYEIWQMDVKTAFLNGFVEEEIFMDQPEGFTAVGEEQKVCRLQRSIYGLKQASRSWNTRFDEVIRGYDFIKNDYDPCIYKKISGSSVAYFVLYVDDILLIGNDVKMFGDIKAWLSTQFSMKDMGEASYILGIKIYRDRSRRMLGLTQSSYIEKSPKTDEELKRMSNIPYTSALGSIQYAVQCSRPNVAYPLSAIATLASSRTMMMPKFQSGFVFKLNGGVVAWKSSKQDTTTNSTMEAEYIAASEAAKEAVWMKNYIQELGVVPSIAEAVVIFCDNNGAIAQVNESRSHHRSKHILRRYHLLMEMVSRGDCRMDRVSSAENTTDSLTKPISQVTHTQHLDKMV
ncbi:UNVERIFIED_CONTAM: Retrovirus-related Pol polyprotein from transposon TNT 1-94 [Sesamum latifolium]|uniref:Retrovirus-related Pol polyprotein from transposon TNT 1-94 n=1 Tax=Sesamum latifolium TaxID=2727402 RepID=A0AAW2TMX8_9LAMI